MTITASKRRQRARSMQTRVCVDGVDVTRVVHKVDVRRRRIWKFLRDRHGDFVVHPNGREIIRYERRIPRGRLRVISR